MRDISEGMRDISEGMRDISERCRSEHSFCIFLRFQVLECRFFSSYFLVRADPT